jgi:hypothetical protein
VKIGQLLLHPVKLDGSGNGVGGATAELALVINRRALRAKVAADADLLREFITESREHLDNIEQGVLVLENSAGRRRDPQHDFPRVPHVQGRRGLSEFPPHQPPRARAGIAARPGAAGQAGH